MRGEQNLKNLCGTKKSKDVMRGEREEIQAGAGKLREQPCISLLQVQDVMRGKPYKIQAATGKQRE